MQRLLDALNFSNNMYTLHRVEGVPTTAAEHNNLAMSVASLMVNVGDIDDEDLVSCAVLHGVLDETTCTVEDLSERYGSIMANALAEIQCSGDFTEDEQWQHIVNIAPKISTYAKTVLLAFFIYNVVERSKSGYDASLHGGYLTWAKKVVDSGLRGVNGRLERFFDMIVLVNIQGKNDGSIFAILGKDDC